MYKAPKIFAPHYSGKPCQAVRIRGITRSPRYQGTINMQCADLPPEPLSAGGSRQKPQVPTKELVYRAVSSVVKKHIDVFFPRYPRTNEYMRSSTHAERARDTPQNARGVQFYSSTPQFFHARNMSLNSTCETNIGTIQETAQTNVLHICPHSRYYHAMQLLIP